MDTYVFFSLCARRRDTNHSRLYSSCVRSMTPGVRSNGSTYRPAANDSEAAELLEAAGWIDWDAAAGVGPAYLVVAVPHVITYVSLPPYCRDSDCCSHVLLLLLYIVSACISAQIQD